MQALERQRPIGYPRAKDIASSLMHNASIPGAECDLLYEELAASFLVRFVNEQLAINLGIDYKSASLRLHTFYPDDSYVYLKSRFHSGSDGLNPADRSGTEKFHLAWTDPSEGNYSLNVTTFQNTQACMVEIAIGNSNSGTFIYSDTFEKSSFAQKLDSRHD